MVEQTPAARRRRRVEILKARRASGKIKAAIPTALKKKRAEVERLKKEKLSMKKTMDKNKAQMRAQVKQAKQRINAEKKRNALLEKKLRQERAQAKKKAKKESMQSQCSDAHLSALHGRMVSAVPHTAEIKALTNKEYSHRRKEMVSAWTAVKKYLATCHKAKFESAKRSKPKKTCNRRSGSMPAFRNRPVFLPDIGVDIDEAAFNKATAQIFGRASPLKTNKKKKKLAPTFVAQIV